MEERPDGFRYQWITIYADSMRFFLAAARHYQLRLEKEVERIQADDLFSKLFEESELDSLDIAKEAQRFKDIADRLQSKIDASPNAWDYDQTLYHREVRILKSLGIFYLNNLTTRRNELGMENSFSPVALQALDSRISRFRELLESGVFGEATPWPLLLEPTELIESDNFENPQVSSDGASSLRRPPVRIISSIGILDSQLRERCLDVLEQFDQQGEPHRYDTVISEATRVLEDRVRRISGASADLDGVALMSFVFAGTSPRLVISQDPAEQEAAHLMFRGVFGYVRNPYHHRLIENVALERVIQILGMIDFLLLLVQNATLGNNAT